LARRAPDVPVYVGLAGPASPVALLRYAQRCGVGASLRALQSQGMGAVRLVTHADPSEQLTALARHSRSGSATHVGGRAPLQLRCVARTARWMNERITARCG
jgi:methylenetetrahydrofolate reductase (NADPH)